MTERLPPAPAPEDLPEPKGGEVITLEAGAVWARLYLHAGRHPTRWDRFRSSALPSPGRFDAFGAPDVGGVAYAAIPFGEGGSGQAIHPVGPGDASALATCLAEAAQQTRTLDRFDQRSFAVAELTHPLRLLDVSSDWSTRAGAGAHLSTAPRWETSRWAVSIASRWPDLDGVAYVAATRRAGRAIALWSPRARDAVVTSRLLLLRTLDDPVLRGALSWSAHITGVQLLASNRKQP